MPNITITIIKRTYCAYFRINYRAFKNIEINCNSYSQRLPDVVQIMKNEYLMTRQSQKHMLKLCSKLNLLSNSPKKRFSGYEKSENNTLFLILKLYIVI